MCDTSAYQKPIEEFVQQRGLACDTLSQGQLAPALRQALACGEQLACAGGSCGANSSVFAVCGAYEADGVGAVV